MSLMWRIARRLATSWPISGDVAYQRRPLSPMAAPMTAAAAEIGGAADLGGAGDRTCGAHLEAQ
eukprot:5741517-Heterocapsa_arctica.AAC.1